MSAIPGEPHDSKPDELTTSDGRKVRLNIPGLTVGPAPAPPQERGAAEPPPGETEPTNHVEP